MDKRQSWLCALGNLIDSGFDPEAPVPCPNADGGHIQHRYVVDPQSRLGFAVIWCDRCADGALISRARAPEGAVTAEIADPGALDGVPDLVFATNDEDVP